MLSEGERFAWDAMAARLGRPFQLERWAKAALVEVSIRRRRVGYEWAVVPGTDSEGLRWRDGRTLSRSGAIRRARRALLDQLRPLIPVTDLSDRPGP